MTDMMPEQRHHTMSPTSTAHAGRPLSKHRQRVHQHQVQDDTRVDSGEEAEGERGRTRTSRRQAKPGGPRPHHSRSRSRSDPPRHDAVHGAADGQAVRSEQPARHRSSSLDSYHDARSSQHERHAQTTRRHRMSPTEKVYASPDEATTALRAERAINPTHRPAPAAHVSRSRRHQEPVTPVDANFDNDVAVYDSDDAPEGYEPAIRHMASHLSLRSTKSRVSFNDERLNGHGRDGSADGAIRTQVIGAGNMQPNHRALSRDMLRPALRGSTSRVNLPASNRAEESDSSLGVTPYPAHLRQSLQPPKRQGSDKALPHRPISMISPNVPPRASVTEDLHDVLSSVDRSDPQQSDFGAIHERHEQMAPPPGMLRRKTRREMRPREYDPSHKVQPTRPKLRNFLSSFSSLSVSQPPQQTGSDRHLPLDRDHDADLPPIHPAEDMALYLHRACVPEWVDWPAILGGNDSKRKGSAAKWLAGLNIPGGTGSGSHASMGWEWSRRLGAAMGNQQGHGRRLGGWEGMRAFEQIILDWCSENVPSEPIDMANRWGKQIFALPARGFDTLEFHDEKSTQAPDMGLLSWLTGSLLQTITSLLHTLRYTSSTFRFHLIPSPIPPEWSQACKPDTHALWEGFGTLVMLNDQSATDRSLVLSVRPPSIVTGKVLREFGRTRREWWSLPGELCLGSTGQANLLQQQVYDDCVQNQVFWFVVTNLKYWVFGKFLTVKDPSYTTASVSEPIHFRSREPSVMQCLATWVVRSVDERPRAIEASRQVLRAPASPQMQAQAPVQAPAYSPPSRRSARGHTRAQSYPVPQQAYQQPFAMYDPTHPSSSNMWANQYPGQPQTQAQAQYAPHSLTHPMVGRQNSAPVTSPMMSDFGMYLYPTAQGQVQSMQGMQGQRYGHGHGILDQNQNSGYQAWSQGIERPFSPYGDGSDLGHGTGHGYASMGARGPYGQPGRAIWYGSTRWGYRQ